MLSSTFWRRALFIAYVAAALLLCGWIVKWTAAPREMVQLHDQEAVMRRHTTGILTEITVSAPHWNTVTVTDRETLFALSQQMDLIPKMEGEAPREKAALSGVMVFGDGSRVRYSVGSVMTRGDVAYYSEETAAELTALRQSLAARIYTPGNLTAFFEAPNRVALSDGSTLREMDAPTLEQLCREIEVGQEVEDPENAGQTLAGRTPRYVLHVLDQQEEELLRLDIYANESTLLYSQAASEQDPLLCFSGQLFSLCESLWQEP